MGSSGVPGGWTNPTIAFLGSGGKASQPPVGVNISRATERASGPATLTMPSPPGPGGVLIAVIVSVFRAFMSIYDSPAEQIVLNYTTVREWRGIVRMSEQGLPFSHSLVALLTLSFTLFLFGFRFRGGDLGGLVQVVLVSDGEDVVYGPVKNEAGGKVEEHRGEDNGHE